MSFAFFKFFLLEFKPKFTGPRFLKIFFVKINTLILESGQFFMTSGSFLRDSVSKKHLGDQCYTRNEKSNSEKFVI